MSTAISPLAPTDVPEMPAIAGVKLATAAAGIRYGAVIEVEQSVVSTEPKVNVPSGNGVSIFRGGAGGLSYFSSASFRGALRVGAS